MLIVKHDKSDIVELEDGSWWRIWPGDIAATLQWLLTTNLHVLAIEDEFCSHALIDQTDGPWLGVIEAGAVWPACQVDDLGSKGKPEPRALRVEADDVETDKGHHYFVAGWRRLWSWYGYLVAEGGSNASPFKCQ